MGQWSYQIWPVLVQCTLLHTAEEFSIVFYNSIAISGIQVSRGCTYFPGLYSWVLGVWKPKAGNTIHKDGNQCCVFRYCTSHSQPGRPRPSPAVSFISPSSPISAHQWPHQIPVVHRTWFHRTRKQLPPVKADLAICSPIIGTCG